MRLNTNGLRRGSLPVVSTETAFARLTRLYEHGRLTRRNFLQAGALALPGTYAADALGAERRVDIVENGGTVEFRVDGCTRWVIDPARFGGTPNLTLRRDTDGATLELSRALFPGTSIPADFTCNVSRPGRRWLFRIAMAWGRFRSAGHLVPWLEGEQPLESAWNGEMALAVGHVALRASGRGAAEFSPNWSLLISGDRLLSIRGLGSRFHADGFALRLAENASPSLLQASWPQRTLLGAARGRHTWESWSAVADLDPEGRLRASGDPFDTLVVEAAEDSRRTRRALVLQQTRRDGRVAYSPAALRGGDGGPLTVPLSNVRFAVSGAGASAERMLVADYPGVSLGYTGGIRVALGAAHGTPPFEVVVANRQLVRLTFEPAVIDISAPVAGAVSGTCQVADRANGECRDERLAEDSKQWLRSLLHPIRSRRERPKSAGDRPHGAPGFPLAGVTLRVRRPEDLLVLEFTFKDLYLRTRIGRDPVICTRPGTEGRLTVHFPPQQIAEQAFYQTDPNLPLDANRPPDETITVPARSVMARSSRLVFKVSPGAEIGYTLRGLLDWSRLTPSVAPTALPSGATNTALGPLAQLEDAYTAIENPYRLVMSPHAGSAWAHSQDAVCDRDRTTELWHTRLGSRVEGGVDERNDADRTLRAIWSPDLGHTGREDTLPFRMSLTPADRNEIVSLCTDYHALDSPTERRTAAIAAKRLMLTGLGAWMDARGAWEPPAGLSLEEYIHRETTGRDNFVRIVRKGYLYPLGHRASLITETERRYERVGGRFVAVLRQRKYIKIRQRDKKYPAVGQPYEGRYTGFQRILFEDANATTPYLDLPVKIETCEAFWPHVGGRPYEFQFSGIDRAGRQIALRAPLIFIDAAHVWVAPDGASISSCVNTIGSEYRLEANRIRRTIDVRGQVVSLVSADNPETAAYPTNTILLTGQRPAEGVGGVSLYRGDQAPFYPGVEQIVSQVPAVAELTGRRDPVAWQLAPLYLKAGFDPDSNRGTAYAELLAPIKLELGAGRPSADRTGGLATPNGYVVGFTLRNGLVFGRPASSESRPAVDANGLPTTTGALADVAAGRFEPRDFFGALSSAKLLGVVDLQDVIEGVAQGVADNLGDAPKLLRRAIYTASSEAATAADALARAVGDLPAEVRDRFLPLVQAIAQRARAVSQAPLDPGALSSFVQSVTAFHDAVAAVLADPSALLPPTLRALREIALNPQNDLRARVFELVGGSDQIAAVRSAVKALQDQLEAARLSADDTIASAVADLQRAKTDLEQRAVAAAAEIEQALRDRANAHLDVVLAAAASVYANVARYREQAAQLIDAATVAQAQAAQIKAAVETAVQSVVQPGAVPRQQVRAGVEQIWAALPADARRETEPAKTAIIEALKSLERLGAEVDARARRERLRAELKLVNSVRQLADKLPVSDNARQTLVDLAQRYTQLARLGSLSEAQLRNALAAIRTQLTEAFQEEIQRRIDALVAAAVDQQADALARGSRLLAELQIIDERATWLLLIAGNVQPSVAASLVQLRNQLVAAEQMPAAALRASATSLRNAVLTVIAALPDVAKDAVGPALTAFASELQQFATGAKGPKDLASLAAAAITAKNQLLQVISDPLTSVPALAALKQRVERFLAQFAIPEWFELEYSWTPKMKSLLGSPPLFEASFTSGMNQKTPCTLTITAKSRVSLRGQTPQLTVTAELQHFTLNLLPGLPMVALHFTGATFTTAPGTGTHVAVHLDRVVFGDALKFVSRLQKYLNSGSGPFLDIQPSGVLAGFRFALPSLTLGGLNVYNLSFFTAVQLSFTGGPLTLSFGVGDRRNPFIVTVGILGGGGYFALDLNPGGLTRLEAAIEVGAMAEINLAGLAHGRGYIFAGFFFSLREVGQPPALRRRTRLCGYVRAGGELSIIGLISMSLELYCGICWQDNPSRVTGTARLSVEIHLFFFEVTLNIEVTYTFAGGGDSAQETSEAAQLPQAAPQPAFDWTEYQAAFS